MKQKRHSPRFFITASAAIFAAAVLMSGCDGSGKPVDPSSTYEPLTTAVATVPETTAVPEETDSEKESTAMGQIIGIPGTETRQADQLRLHNMTGDWWQSFADTDDSYVFVAASVEELTTGLKERHMEELDVSKYDEAFFEENRLALIPRAANSGSVRYRYSLFETADGVEITLFAQVPEIGTCDMADWLVAVPVPVAEYSEETVITVNPAGTNFLPSATTK